MKSQTSSEYEWSSAHSFGLDHLPDDDTDKEGVTKINHPTKELGVQKALDSSKAIFKS